MNSDIQSIEAAWRVVSDLYCEAVHLSAVPKHCQIEDELLFCLLGGFGITFEHGRSAANAIKHLRPFSNGRNDEELFGEILSALEYPQFEPCRNDGSLRRYRFPRQKACNIVRARRWVRGHDPLDEHLLKLANAKERRRFLIECPGIGLKTASWLLRNLGLGAELAIIDVHLIRALMGSKRIPEDVRLPRDYELAEEAFLVWCDELNAPSAAFDLFVWHWQRGTLSRA